MTIDERPHILCVDDEPNVLEGLVRSLRSQYRVAISSDPAGALAMFQPQDPFAVVVSDMRMPGMNGVFFLAHARKVAPDTVRVLLTGQADMESAIGAINEGQIFRFLTKPCPTDILLKTLAACIEQHRLVSSERVLLEQTLRGSIKTLTEILSLASPVAFGRATRVRQSLVDLTARLEIRDQWPIEVAAMLSQIGYIILPPQTVEKLYKGHAVTPAETEMIERVPGVVEQLLSNIPRLEPVREILRDHWKPFARAKKEAGIRGAAEPSWGARALRIAIDYDVLESAENPSDHPFDVMRGRVGHYDPEIFEVFAEMHGGRKREIQVLELHLRDVCVGMVLGEDVRSAKGVLLIARGQEVTPGLLERLRNFSPDLGIREPIRMVNHAQALAPVPAEVVSR
jgi:response regulator RpfG family c-di-GMP phosphodiesterase